MLVKMENLLQAHAQYLMFAKVHLQVHLRYQLLKLTMVLFKKLVMKLGVQHYQQHSQQVLLMWLNTKSLKQMLISMTHKVKM